MKKKILWLFGIFFVMLSLSLVFYFSLPKLSKIPSTSAFELNERCPHLCWMGISPGVTTTEQAQAILRSSWEIDQVFFHSSDTVIQTRWFPETTRTHRTNVWLNSEEGIVESIHFMALAPFQLRDIVAMLGEPDLIIIRHEETPHSTDMIDYMVYFSKYRARLGVVTGHLQGPDPQDYLASLSLNIDFLKDETFSDKNPQPWLGYGHFEDYLPGVATPTPANNYPTP